MANHCEATAVNKSLVVLAGALREITISIIGDSDDFAIEVASGSWFESLLIPGVTGFLVGGPLGSSRRCYCWSSYGI